MMLTYFSTIPFSLVFCNIVFVLFQFICVIHVIFTSNSVNSFELSPNQTQLPSVPYKVALHNHRILVSSTERGDTLAQQVCSFSDTVLIRTRLALASILGPF